MSQFMFQNVDTLAVVDVSGWRDKTKVDFIREVKRICGCAKLEYVELEGEEKSVEECTLLRAAAYSTLQPDPDSALANYPSCQPYCQVHHSPDVSMNAECQPSHIKPSITLLSPTHSRTRSSTRYIPWPWPRRLTRTQRRYIRITFYSSLILLLWFSSFEYYASIHARLKPTASKWLINGLDFGVGRRDVNQRPESARSKESNSPRASLSALGNHTYRDDGLLEVNQDGAHPIFELVERAQREWDDKLARASRTLQEAVEEYRRRYKRKPPRGFERWWAYVKKHHVLLPDAYDAIYEDLEPFWGLSPSSISQIRAELEMKKDSYTIGKDTTSAPPPSSSLSPSTSWPFSSGSTTPPTTNRRRNITVLHTSFHPHANPHELLKRSVGILDLLNEVDEHYASFDWSDTRMDLTRQGRRLKRDEGPGLPPFRATFSPHDGPNRMIDWGVWEE
ncbi:hypothetical protein D9758_009723, partial [Tetrapyrgos nigripes]